MRENFWDFGACSKLNRRGMNYGHVGCGRTLDWVLIPGTPLFSMRMWKYSTKFVGCIWNEQMCSCAGPTLHGRGRSVLLKFHFLCVSHMCGIRYKIREILQVSHSGSKLLIDKFRN